MTHQELIGLFLLGKRSETPAEPGSEDLSAWAEWTRQLAGEYLFSSRQAIPVLLPPGPQPEPGPASLEDLGRMLREESWFLLREWLQYLLALQMRFPPLYLPQLLRAIESEPGLAHFAYQLAGPEATALSRMHPQWNAWAIYSSEEIPDFQSFWSGLWLERQMRKPDAASRERLWQILPGLASQWQDFLLRLAASQVIASDIPALKHVHAHSEQIHLQKWMAALLWRLGDRDLLLAEMSALRAQISYLSKQKKPAEESISWEPYPPSAILLALDEDESLAWEQVWKQPWLMMRLLENAVLYKSQGVLGKILHAWLRGQVDIPRKQALEARHFAALQSATFHKLAEAMLDIQVPDIGRFTLMLEHFPGLWNADFSTRLCQWWNRVFLEPNSGQTAKKEARQLLEAMRDHCHPSVSEALSLQWQNGQYFPYGLAQQMGDTLTRINFRDDMLEAFRHKL